MELRDDRILVVTWIADECTLRVRIVAWQIVLASRVLAYKQMKTVRTVKIRIVVRAIRIEGIEIEARRAKIAQGIRIVVALEFGVGIEGDAIISAASARRSASSGAKGGRLRNIRPKRPS